MTAVQRAIGAALFSYGLYITLTCPCEPLWKCHELEIGLTLAALTAFVNLEIAGIFGSVE